MFTALNAQEEVVSVNATGLPVVDAREQLPQGAYLHVELNDVGQIIQDVEQLALSALPEKALPEQMQSLLSQPNPLLTLIGVSTLGQPLDESRLGMMLGLGTELPITFSLYPGQPKNSWIASLPVSSLPALNGLLINGLQVTELEEHLIGGEHKAYRLVTAHPQLPSELFVVGSEQRLFLCGSEPLAHALCVTTSAQSLNASQAIGQAGDRFKASDLFVVADPSFAKAFLPMIAQQYPTIPPELFENLREGVWNGLPAEQISNWNLRLRFQYGIDGIDEALDYTEAFAVAGYETLLEELVPLLSGFHGVAVAIDLSGEYQGLTSVIYSEAFEAEGLEALPIESVQAGLEQLPYEQQHILVTGRSQASTPSEVWPRLLGKLKTEFKQRELGVAWITLAEGFFANYQSELRFEDLPAWIATVGVFDAFFPGPRDAGSVESYLADYYESLSGTQTIQGISVSPAMKEPAIRSFFEKRAEIIRSNQAAVTHFAEKTETEDIQWYTRSADISFSKGKQGLLQAIFEKSYTTEQGFWGYSDHTLINREHYSFLNRAGYTLHTSGKRNASLLTDAAKSSETAALEPLAKRLFEEVPAGVNGSITVNQAPELELFVAELVWLENAIHEEIEAYMAKVNAIAAEKGSDEAALEEALLPLDIPFFLQTLNLNEAGDFYPVLIGGLSYPRPKVMPLLEPLLQDYFSAEVNSGGVMSYTTQGEGHYEAGIKLGTLNFATFIKTAVNAFYEIHWSSPGSQQALFEQIISAQDFQGSAAEIYIYNPHWEAFIDWSEGLDEESLELE